MNNQEREYLEWLQLCERIRNNTTQLTSETSKEKQDRIAVLLNNFESFCKYYFPDFMETGLGWFHKQAAQAISKNRGWFVLEWPRAHAKSIFADMYIPLFLKAKGDFSGMIIASHNATKADGLLGTIQAQLMENQRYINDFGPQYSHGNWNSGHFVTRDGSGFWAFGSGQSPRGVRVGAKRPSYAVIDDIDEKEIVRNQARVKEAVSWVREDLWGCLDINNSRLVVAGNRIHKHSILAHIVGDIEPDKPKHDYIHHIKVFATEDKNHQCLSPDNPKAKPAWVEYYTIPALIEKMKPMGHRSAQREYYHNHIEDGLIFKNEWLHYEKSLPIDEYNNIVVYCDPSFKDAKTNDFKAIMAVGRKGAKFHILKAFVRQCSTAAMVNGFYSMWDLYGRWAKYYMEANFLQDLLLEEFDRAAEERDTLPIRGDKESKPNKFERIENITPLFERGLISIAEEEKNNADMQVFLSQLLGFGNAGVHDDAPDALEGAISKLQKKHKKGNTNYQTGNYSHNKRKY